jgi:hypothetical protein
MMAPRLRQAGPTLPGGCDRALEHALITAPAPRPHEKKLEAVAAGAQVALTRHSGASSLPRWARGLGRGDAHPRCRVHLSHRGEEKHGARIAVQMAEPVRDLRGVARGDRQEGAESRDGCCGRRGRSGSAR